MNPDNRRQIARILEREFPDSNDRATAQRILHEYGQEAWHSERERVHLAALKLSKSNLATLQETIAAACCDYRDILAWAENPRLMEKPVSFTETRKEYDEFAAQDSKEYAEWLNQPSRT